ncbi:MAG: hypothetical protein ABJN36_10080 [Cyclobacteriaceae bacterium]
MKLSKSILLMLFLIGSTVMSCIYGECDPVPGYFKITGINSVNMRLTSDQDQPIDPIREDGMVDWENYLIQYEFSTELIAKTENRFGSTLMATSCNRPGSEGDKIGLDTLYLTAGSDYNAEFKQGDTLNSIVLIQNYIHTYSLSEFDSISTYITQNKEGVRNDQFILRLAQPPVTTGKYAFLITYILNNGDLFTNTTNPVSLRVD